MAYYHAGRSSRTWNYRRILFIATLITGALLIGSMYFRWDDVAGDKRPNAADDDSFLGAPSLAGGKGGKVEGPSIDQGLPNVETEERKEELNALAIKEKVQAFKEELAKNVEDTLPGSRNLPKNGEENAPEKEGPPGQVPFEKPADLPVDGRRMQAPDAHGEAPPGADPRREEGPEAVWEAPPGFEKDNNTYNQTVIWPEKSAAVEGSKVKVLRKQNDTRGGAPEIKENNTDIGKNEEAGSPKSPINNGSMQGAESPNEDSESIDVIIPLRVASNEVAADIKEVSEEEHLPVKEESNEKQGEVSNQSNKRQLRRIEPSNQKQLEQPPDLKSAKVQDALRNNADSNEINKSVQDESLKTDQKPDVQATTDWQASAGRTAEKNAVTVSHDEQRKSVNQNDAAQLNINEADNAAGGDQPEDAPSSFQKTNQPSRNNYSCTVPQLDPWDKSLLKFLDHYPMKICRKVQQDMMYIDADNYLRLNDTELKAINLTADEVECVYNTIERADQEEDFQARLGPTNSYVKPVKIDSDVIQVNCVSKSDRTLLYGEVLTYPALETDNVNYANNSEDKLNVVMLFIDSLSLSAVQRHMPKTYQYLVKNMGFLTMEGYNKVADNTFPNVIPILTGKRVHNQQANMLDEFHEDVNMIYFDHWPIIWKNFSAKGYMTSFTEESPDLGTFHIKGHGFMRKPVDHFYINYWKALEWMTYPKQASPGCYGNRTPAQILLDIISNHLIKFKDLAQFIFSFLTYPSHSDSAKLETIDHYYLQFFQSMNERQLFNRSVVMFLSDHGHRDSAIRSTTVGLLEERLPVCMLYFPPWFYKKYPAIKENLILNYDRLASNFDIHETLIDILEGNYGPASKQRPGHSRGLTLLQPIPTDRTCTSAGIPVYFCTCQQLEWTKIDTKSNLAKYAAADFVYALNEIVQKNHLCARWTLKELLSAEVMGVTAKDAGVSVSPDIIQDDVYHTDLQLVRVTIEAEVNWVRGIFQALMLFNNAEKQLSLHSDIGRLDRYGKQSLCVGTDANSQLKKLCVCRSYVMNETTPNA